MDNKKTQDTAVDTGFNTGSYKLSKDLFTSGKITMPAVPDDDTPMLPEQKEKKTRTRKPKEVEGPFVGEVVQDFRQDYNETDMMLRSAIGQTDALLNDIGGDLQQIRAAKAMTNKYRYITDLSSTMSALISTKISAARELNNSVTHAIDFNMKREKELKAAAQASAQDDDRRIMDMYNAYMSIPLGTYQPNGPVAPNIRELTFGKDPNGMGGIEIGDAMQAGFQDYLNTMSPTQNLMRYENNPDVQTVVVFDQSTGQKWFDVINIRTGESIPNVPKPDDFLLEATRPDLANGVARNSNIDMTYPLIVVGNRSAIAEY